MTVHDRADIGLQWKDWTLPGGQQVRVFCLDCPARRNCLSPEILTALNYRIREAADRAILLTACPPVFSAGSDFDALLSAVGRPMGFARSIGQLYGVYSRLLRHPYPTFACVDGPAYGGGVGLVLCCDFILATTRASFTLPLDTLRPVARVILPLAKRRHLSEWNGTTMSAATSLDHGVIDEFFDGPPTQNALIERVGARLLRSVPSRREPLDRLAACAELRAAFDPQSVNEVSQFLHERRRVRLMRTS